MRWDTKERQPNRYRSMAFLASPQYDKAPARSPAREECAELSRAISLSRLVLIIGLVFVHYGNFPNSEAFSFLGLDTNEHQFATWVNSVMVFFFFSAVPLMSIISGWLFFAIDPSRPWPALRKRIRRRFVSLYIPLVVWNAVYLVILYAIYIHSPQLTFFTHSHRFPLTFASPTPLELVNAVFAVTSNPISFQFWFVRDLFVTALISPLLWIMLRYFPWIGMVVLGAGWLLGVQTGLFTRLDVPFFFCLGGLIRLRRVALAVPLPRTLVLLAVFLMLIGLRALAPYAVPAPSIEAEPLWLQMATRLMRLPGVLVCWGLLYHCAQTQAGAAISRFGGLAFFLHSAHWPLLALVKVTVWRFMPADTDAGMLLHYTTSVLLTVAIGLSAGYALARWMPRCFAFMNGGRLLEEGLTKPAPKAAAGRYAADSGAPLEGTLVGGYTVAR